jgi:excisionase family DNA binding protein
VPFTSYPECSFGSNLASKRAVATDEISPQEAAAILQMSRPSVMRLIAKGQLHPRKVLSHNKLSRAEVDNYQHEQSRQQRQALSNLVTLTEEYDF